MWRRKNQTRKRRKWRRRRRERTKRKRKRTYEAKKVSEGIKALNKYMKCGE